MDQLQDVSADLRKQLAFTCSQERDRIPPRDEEAEQLYRRARWLIKGNILKQDPNVYPGIERLLRIANAYGHDKANIELQDLLGRGQASSVNRGKEMIDLAEDLIRRAIPSGYYSMGWYLEHGSGVRADPDLALKYYRKSADLGSPQGQYLVGDKLSDQSKFGLETSKIGWAMYACAADQHHAKAAYEYALYLQSTDRKPEALRYFQIATSEGLAVAPSTLSDAFSEKTHADPIFGLGLGVDSERQSRYNKISNFLSDYEYLNPVVHEIDEIVPLPPAKLPAWNGKFHWLEEHKANVPPPIPTDERIVEMARAKGLDPNTGRALAASK